MSRDDFLQKCKAAGIGDDKPLSLVLETLFDTAAAAKDAVQDGARGLTPEGEADLIKRVVRAVEVQSRQALEQHRLRLDRKASLLAGGVVAASLLLTGLGGYWWGWSGGRQSVAVLEQDVATAFQSGPDAAGAWLRLMRNNDPTQALAQCSGNAVWSSNGRQACSVPLWIDGPGTPTMAKR